jgi:hypothetical protein
MKEHDVDSTDDGDEMHLNRVTYRPSSPGQRPTLAAETGQKVYKGVKKFWKRLDDEILKPYFGGSTGRSSRHREDTLGNYELSALSDSQRDDSSCEDDEGEFGHFHGQNGRSRS